MHLSDRLVSPLALTPQKHFRTPNRWISRSALVLLLLSFAPSLNAQTSADFSGKWAFDQSKSDPGKGGSFLEGDVTLQITQTANSITIDRTTKRPESEDITASDQYTLDGKESVKKDDMGTTKTRAQWSEDKQVLTITTIMTVGAADYRTDDSYSLTDQGKTLTVKSFSKNPTGERTTVSIHAKK